MESSHSVLDPDAFSDLVRKSFCLLGGVLQYFHCRHQDGLERVKTILFSSGGGVGRVVCACGWEEEEEVKWRWSEEEEVEVVVEVTV